MQSIKQLLTAALCFAALVSSAQSKQEKKYVLRAKEVEEEIMNVPDTFFSVTSIPDSYKDASAVILAKRMDLFSDLKSKMRYSLFYGKDVTNTIRYALTIRERIKIQDKSALNEYAEFSFSKLSRQSNFFKNSAYTFVGISLVKPDGTVKKIDVDEEAVNVESEDEKDKYKLAIPGLEVGDVIDLYSRVEKESSSENPIDPMDLLMGGDHPVLKFAINTKIRNDFAVIYTATNGAPVPSQTRDDEFIYLKSYFTNIGKAPEDLWLYDRRELPVLKLNIVPANAPKRNRFAPQKGEVVKGMSKDWIDADLSAKLQKIVSGVANWNTLFLVSRETLRKTKKARHWDDDNKDSLINYIYYYGRFALLYNSLRSDKIQVGLERNAASTDYDFYSYLIAAFNYFKIDYDFMFTVARASGTIQSAVAPSDFYILLRARGKGDYYLFPPNIYSIANSFPSAFEGQEAYVFKNTSDISSNSKSTIERLPFTRPSFNYASEDLKVSVADGNPLQLAVNRTKVERGNLAYDDQLYLTLFEEYVNDERARMGEGPLSEELLDRMGKKKGTVLWEEYQKKFAETRTKRDEYAKKEAESTYETKLVSFDGFKVLSTGNRHDQRDFSFTEHFVIDGLVKKAGNNYILTLGSLITSQVEIKKEQRERKHNIHMPYARSFAYSISFDIPAGFSVEGLEGLNKNVTNSSGSFVSKAELKNNQLVVNINKVYNHYYEPVSNWKEMLEFIDAAYDFSQQKVLLRKL